MKIGFAELNLPEGKVKYEDDVLNALAEKDRPKKVTPYFAEFVCNEFIDCDAILVGDSSILDVLINDIEKIEARGNQQSDTDDEIFPDNADSLIDRCLVTLEAETPLCEMALNKEEQEMLKSIGVISLKPVVTTKNDIDGNTAISIALSAAGLSFFYTSGPTESHAWLIEIGSDIVTCAGKIHSELARGFIKGDVVGFDDYMKYHNFNECRSKGVARLVDADYIVQEREIIEIRAKT